jgi:hypothetical protein
VLNKSRDLQAAARHRQYYRGPKQFFEPQLDKVSPTKK